MSVSELRHVSTTKIHPANYIHKSTDNYKPIDLNPWDILFLRQLYMQKGFLFAKSSQLLDRFEDHEKEKSDRQCYNQ
ncbi:hypothetical protein MKX01_012859 [Papaver californicum]|nr:hypothetical protein MKX01_012859 [Papaver californicum]